MNECFKAMYNQLEEDYNKLQTNWNSLKEIVKDLGIDYILDKMNELEGDKDE